MEMTKEQIIHDLQALGEYFSESCGAVPIAINEAIRILSAKKPQKKPNDGRSTHFVVVEKTSGNYMTPFFSEMKTAQLALNSLEGMDIMNDTFEPDSYQIRMVYGGK